MSRVSCTELLDSYTDELVVFHILGTFLEPDEAEDDHLRQTQRLKLVANERIQIDAPATPRLSKS